MSADYKKDIFDFCLAELNLRVSFSCFGFGSINISCNDHDMM